MDTLKSVESFLKKYNLNKSSIHFLIGFSGGADSMLLLYFLKELRKKYKFNMSALHINHGWRGEESDEEENVCKKFCEKYKIDFYVEKLNPKIKKDENSARIARYDLFNQYAKKLKADAILTAHNSTDAVETFIYRLLKGMGSTGAMSVPEVRNAQYCKIFRPLININSKTIRNECKNLGLKYNIDSSNFNSKYKRNFIRNELFPNFEKINPSFENSILTFIENIKSNNNLLENYLKDDCEKVIEDNKIKTQRFIEFSQDIKRVIVYKFLKNNDFEPEKNLILRMIEQIDKNANKPNGKKYSVKRAENILCNISFFCSKEECYFVKNTLHKKETIKFDKKFCAPIKVLEYKNQKIPKSDAKMVIVKKDAIIFPLELRTRKSGDIIQPFSHKSTVKLKDYFIEKKIPEHKRNEIMLLCKGKEVLWAIGVGLSEKLRADLTLENSFILKYDNL